MGLKSPVAAMLAVGCALAAGPLPELRTEPVNGGSVFHVKNTGSQPVTAFLIELVNYPGSYYAMWQDEAASPLIAPGEDKRIPVTNMTVGAVPDYVKLRAAIFADGSTAGVPEKVTQLIERRKHVLAITRELIARIGKGAKPADLKQWSDSLQPARRADPTAQATINQNAARGAINDAASWLDSHSPEETLAKLRSTENALAASKPPL